MPWRLLNTSPDYHNLISRRIVIGNRPRKREKTHSYFYPNHNFPQKMFRAQVSLTDNIHQKTIAVSTIDPPYSFTQTNFHKWTFTPCLYRT